MAKKSKKQQALEESIIKTLTDAGWKKTTKGETFGKADMAYDNGSVTLEVETSWKPGWVNLSIYDRSGDGSDFSMNCPDNLSQLLVAIVSFQDKISFKDYKRFLSQLVGICPKIYVDTGDELVPLVDDGEKHA